MQASEGGAPTLGNFLTGLVSNLNGLVSFVNGLVSSSEGG